MAPRQRRAATAACALALAVAGAAPAVASAESDAAIERGRYVFAAGGCHACHTDEAGGGEPLAGGEALPTPFGTFYPPNITPDEETGIGGWSDADFLRAMRQGLSPDGQHYYPAFPYTTYARASERDLLDLKAYLFSRPAVRREDRPHALDFPFSYRPLLWFWKLLNFAAEPWRDNPAKTEAWNRGGYLVNALTHCGECHTPRDFLGGLDRSRWLAGARVQDSRAPNLTPHDSGLAGWSASDIAFALAQGIAPDGEILGGLMAEVVRHSTGRLSDADRRAIAAYLRDLPPRPSQPEPDEGG